MDILKLEKFILPIVQDFDNFIKYLEEETPILTAKKEVLGKNHCFNINSKLNFKRDVTGPKYNQDQYLVIDLMFSLAVNSGLYLITCNERGKATLLKTKKLDTFLELNNYEKYIFILENYWSKYEFNEKSEFRYMIIGLLYIIDSMAKGSAGKPIYQDQTNGVAFLKPAIFLHNLYYLGLCQLEIIEEAKNKYDELVKCIRPTELGVIVCKKLVGEGKKYLNIENLELLINFEEIGEITEESKSLFSVLKEIFPDNMVKKTVECEEDVDRTGVYTFKVSLNKKIWRKIRMSHKNTFYDLHLIIQEAYEFDNDHMFQFNIGSNRRRAKTTYMGNPYEMENDSTMEKANLYKGQKIIYLFDFGDMWQFDITIVDIDNKSPLPIRPEILESKGDSPEQYPEWEDDWE